MQSKIKWGVLGYANIAKNAVIPAIMESSNAEFFAIASRSTDKIIECRNHFGAVKGYSSYDALLEDSEIQAVYIPLPNKFHKEWTIKAAHKGKHVLCEKPIALNSSECLEMRNECEKNGVLLMEAFMYRYSSRTSKILDIIDSGIIGELRHINSTFGWLNEKLNSSRRKLPYLAELTSTFLLNKSIFLTYNDLTGTDFVNFLHDNQATVISVLD